MKNYFWVILALFMAIAISLTFCIGCKSKTSKIEKVKTEDTLKTSKENLFSKSFNPKHGYKISELDFKTAANFIYKNGHGKSEHVPFNWSYSFIDIDGNIHEFIMIAKDLEETDVKDISGIDIITARVTKSGSSQSVFTYDVNREYITPAFDVTNIWEDSAVAVKGFNDFLKKISKLK